MKEGAAARAAGPENSSPARMALAGLLVRPGFTEQAIYSSKSSPLHSSPSSRKLNMLKIGRTLSLLKSMS